MKDTMVIVPRVDATHVRDGDEVITIVELRERYPARDNWTIVIRGFDYGQDDTVEEIGAVDTTSTGHRRVPTRPTRETRRERRRDARGNEGRV